MTAAMINDNNIKYTVLPIDIQHKLNKPLFSVGRLQFVRQH